MYKKFSIGRTAKITSLTAEALRHYDRTGLVRPSEVDPDTGYRYYTDSDIVRLNTVKALKQMDMPLMEIKKILDLEDFGEIAVNLRLCREAADRKIAELNAVKERISRAEKYYIGKAASAAENTGEVIKHIPERAVILCELERPSVENLYDYHRHFPLREGFSLNDEAGVLVKNGKRNMFAVCGKYPSPDGLVILECGQYLTEECSEARLESTASKLIEKAKAIGFEPEYHVEMVVLTGILKWNYEVQVPLIKRNPLPGGGIECGKGV